MSSQPAWLKNKKRRKAISTPSTPRGTGRPLFAALASAGGVVVVEAAASTGFFRSAADVSKTRRGGREGGRGNCLAWPHRLIKAADMRPELKLISCKVERWISPFFFFRSWSACCSSAPVPPVSPGSGPCSCDLETDHRLRSTMLISIQPWFRISSACCNGRFAV